MTPRIAYNRDPGGEKSGGHARDDDRRQPAGFRQGQCPRLRFLFIDGGLKLVISFAFLPADQHRHDEDDTQNNGYRQQDEQRRAVWIEQRLDQQPRGQTRERRRRQRSERDVRRLGDMRSLSVRRLGFGVVLLAIRPPRRQPEHHSANNQGRDRGKPQRLGRRGWRQHLVRPYSMDQQTRPDRRIRHTRIDHV